MLASLPLIVPRDVNTKAYTLWSPTSTFHDSDPLQSNQDGHHQTHQHRRSPSSSTARQSHLSLLKAEEDALAARKSNVRRFGSTWIRPPGVTKTYQAMVDEATERAEAEAQALREQAAHEAAAAEDARVREAVARGELGSDAMLGEDGVDGMVMERDLDEEVPDAEGDGEDGTDEEMEENVEGEDEGNESDRDLDEDVPEAGSYQHTDTEVEDPSSDDSASETNRHPEHEATEHITPAAQRSGGSVFGHGPQVVQNFRMPLPMPTLRAPGSGASNAHTEPDSSMIVSSPTAARPARRGLQGTSQGRAGGRVARYGSGRHGEN